MGQLEKYGLYVLCLVIFLILGVAIWGEPQPARADATARGMPLRGEAKAPAPERPLIDLAELDGGRRGAEPRQTVADPEPKPPVRAGGSVPDEAPPASPAEPPRPTHKVARNDTLEDIARRLGDVRYVALLKELNPTVDPLRMRVDSVLQLPTEQERRALLAKSAAPSGQTPQGETPAAPVGALRTHRVEPGDTFEGLAIRYLGGPGRVGEIIKLNPTVDPTRMRKGQLIKLPAR